MENTIVFARNKIHLNTTVGNTTVFYLWQHTVVDCIQIKLYFSLEHIAQYIKESYNCGTPSKNTLKYDTGKHNCFFPNNKYHGNIRCFFPTGKTVNYNRKRYTFFSHCILHCILPQTTMQLYFLQVYFAVLRPGKDNCMYPHLPPSIVCQW